MCAAMNNRSVLALVPAWNEAAFILYVSQNDGGSNFFIVSLLLGALVMMTIPAISTWIISTSGITYAISQMTLGARKALMIAK